MNICPSCNSSNPTFKMPYPGNFLNIDQLLECKECTLTFVNNMPSEKELNSYYSNQEYYGESFNPFNKEFYEFSLKLAESRLNIIQKHIPEFINKEISILDIGTGNGVFLKILSERGFKKIDCIEPDKVMFTESNIPIRNHFLSIKSIQNEKYDVISLNQVLEHVANPNEFIQNIYSILKPGGFVFIDVPNSDFFFKDDVSPHVTFWNEAALKNFLILNKFYVIFLQSAGMSFNEARIFFQTQLTLFKKLTNPQFLKSSFKRLILRQTESNDTKRFQMNNYGGDRIWLRAIIQKRQ